jgi:hypothetical protein
MLYNKAIPIFRLCLYAGAQGTEFISHWRVQGSPLTEPPKLLFLIRDW